MLKKTAWQAAEACPAVDSEAHVMWAFAFFGACVHYFAYLDEFGHIGPFISRRDGHHNTSPVFGFAGIVLPVTEVRNFSAYFYKLKCNLLEWEIAHDPGHTPAYQWEKKAPPSTP